MRTFKKHLGGGAVVSCSVPVMGVDDPHLPLVVKHMTLVMHRYGAQPEILMWWASDEDGLEVVCAAWLPLDLPPGVVNMIRLSALYGEGEVRPYNGDDAGPGMTLEELLGDIDELVTDDRE